MSEQSDTVRAAVPAASPVRDGSLRQSILVLLDQIDPNPYQPRLSEDAVVIAEIAASIEKNGLMQIPSAREVNGQIQLAFGHTRWKAFQLLGSQGKTALGMSSNVVMPLIVRDLTDLQMFELGVAENIKRRDLNPIETATSMRVYMDGFGKNSEEAAEFFNVSAETVRGTVRLLNLPAVAQQKLGNGEITVGTARVLLSMMKVASEAEIKDALKQIEENDEDVSPEAIIESAVDRLDGVVDMWRDYEGPPRGGRDLWLIKMKNFPNKLLAILTAEELAIALGIQNNAKALKLVGEYLEYIEADSIQEDEEGYDQELHDACKGQAQVRLEALIKLDVTYGERIQHLINPPACTACPFYTKVHGSHYCGLEICYQRKKAAWKIQMIQAASKNLGISIYDEADGNYSMLDSSERGQKTMFAKRDADLRLILRDKVNGYPHQWALDGIKQEYFVVVVIGKAAEKLPGKINNRFRPAARLQQRKDRLFRQKRKELIWEFTAAGSYMFEAMNKAVLENLDDWKYLDDRPPEAVKPADNAAADIKTEYLRRLMVWNLVDRVNHDKKPKQTQVIHTAKFISGLAEKWGMKLPKSIMKMAEQADAEIATIALTPKKEKP
jgi:ParB family chromosome partitioning protein